jgi:hypothetical protein
MGKSNVIGGWLRGLTYIGLWPPGEDSRLELSNQYMKALEHWVLRVADNDKTWFGQNWLRPAKHDRLSPGYILLSSVLLGLPRLLLELA